MAVSDTLAEISPDAVPASWHPEAVPPHAVIAKTIQPREERLEELERYYGPQPETHLYG
jgi:hypothetical protein